MIAKRLAIFLSLGFFGPVVATGAHRRITVLGRQRKYRLAREFIADSYKAGSEYRASPTKSSILSFGWHAPRPHSRSRELLASQGCVRSRVPSCWECWTSIQFEARWAGMRAFVLPCLNGEICVIRSGVWGLAWSSLANTPAAKPATSTAMAKPHTIISEREVFVFMVVALSGPSRRRRREAQRR